MFTHAVLWYYLMCSVISKLSVVKWCWSDWMTVWLTECVTAWCIYTVKPTWRHCTASALTSLISILLWGEGHSHRSWICAPKLCHGQMCYLHIHVLLHMLHLIWESRRIMHYSFLAIVNCKDLAKTFGVKECSNLLQYLNMILERHQQKIMQNNNKTNARKKRKYVV